MNGSTLDKNEKLEYETEFGLDRSSNHAKLMNIEETETVHITVDRTKIIEFELIQRAQEGDRDAFCELSRKYRDALIRVAYGFLHDKDEALDAVQEVFLKAWRKIKTFKKEASLYTWLYRITINHCKDRLRKNWHKSTVLFDDVRPDGEPVDWAGPDDGPSREAQNNERERLVREAIGSLPDKHRDVLLLRELGELSYKEIAETLKCRQGTVMSRLFHARKMLAEKLQPVFEDLL